MLFLLLRYLYRRHFAFYERPYRPLGLFLSWVFGWRMVIELVKEPQAPFEVELPLNMGQILSIPLVGLGLYLLLRAARPTSTAKR